MFAVEIVFWTCLFLVVYTYALYPVCIWLLARFCPYDSEPDFDAAADLPLVTLLVAAHNEEQVIEDKILNSLRLDYPSDRLKIVIASDGSTDATPQIVSRYADRGVQLLNFRQRRGKSGLLNAAIAQTSGEILVLSDANTEYDPMAIRKLVRWFANPQVDVVCGRLLLQDDERGKNVDGIYWRYETFLKNCEGKVGALLGSNGAIYAIRRRAYVPIPGNTIVDDFVIPLLSKLRFRGRIIFEPEAIAYEETAPHIGSEFRRRARIGTGAYQCVPLLWRLLNPRYGWTAFAFLSHKILRWLVPFFLIALVVSNVLLLDRTLFCCAMAVQIGLYGAALLGAWLPGRNLPCRIVRVLTMFVGMNLALLVGFWRWLTSPQTGAWRRTARDAESGELPPAAVPQPAKFRDGC